MLMGAFMWALSYGPPSFGRDCRLRLALRRQESLGFECSHAALPSRGHRLAIDIVPHEEPAYSELFISHLLARKIRSGGGSGRSIVQFERETPGTDPSASCESRAVSLNHFAGSATRGRLRDAGKQSTIAPAR